jgi:N-acetyl-gamma-glutamylphosphate reductase
MSASVFVDGHAGTIGLRIRELLATRSDVSLLEIPFERRKDRLTRRRLLNECDIAILLVSAKPRGLPEQVPFARRYPGSDRC